MVRHSLVLPNITLDGAYLCRARLGPLTLFKAVDHNTVSLGQWLTHTHTHTHTHTQHYLTPIVNTAGSQSPEGQLNAR